MNQDPHKPVLIDEITDRCAPVHGIWLDGTFGAGGYSRAMLKAGAQEIIALDRDPLAHEMAEKWLVDEARITLHKTAFSRMADYAKKSSLDGIMLDIGVSSMQIDIPERGFSFLRDGPLDMRMAQEGASAADILNNADEAEIANILYQYGEERASRRIARAIITQRRAAPLTRTRELALICEAVLPPKKPGQPHPATRSFQALRIAVNAELDELRMALEASIDLLRPDGFLVVVSFHSLEDRIVKKFMADASGKSHSVNRYQPETERPEPKLKLVTRKPVIANAEECAENPRARSAKLRIAQRLVAA